MPLLDAAAGLAGAAWRGAVTCGRFHLMHPPAPPSPPPHLCRTALRSSCLMPSCAGRATASSLLTTTRHAGRCRRAGCGAVWGLGCGPASAASTRGGVGGWEGAHAAHAPLAPACGTHAGRGGAAAAHPLPPDDWRGAAGCWVSGRGGGPADVVPSAHHPTACSWSMHGVALVLPRARARPPTPCRTHPCRRCADSTPCARAARCCRS